MSGCITKKKCQVKLFKIFHLAAPTGSVGKSERLLFQIWWVRVSLGIYGDSFYPVPNFVKQSPINQVDVFVSGFVGK